MVTTNYLTNLENLSDQMGVRVRTAPAPGDWWGVYDRRRKLITLRPKLARWQYDSTFAHELGHAYFGHHGHHPKTELLANRWAACRLITFERLLEHAATTFDKKALAASLGVMPWVIDAFEETLTYSQKLVVSERLSECHVA
ncbi:ImmA/IrrE family metallo-endopeptidase [Glutamicibacter nicotianae]|uniref:IrrE N-terminal-like domain-containing protein n=1 Tax=Glutamicibacter nicotianae TaxID=37929 RepID=A0ABQ0RNW0_GLUNI|nr:ImmA/IrrE family metallo-endopeptidase [Glutamicibacter nicotianae]GEC13502.1 hypothetical protein ANI01nite_27050 [Glutamicibacter nicotianae]